jgi:CRP-like cAMP-binding protein
MVDAEILKKLDIFEGLTAPELKAVTQISEVAEYPKGAMVFKENEEAGKLYVLLEGRIAIQFEVGRHLEAVVHTVTPGQAFGWSALVQPYQFTASARCMDDSRVVTVDREGLRNLLELDCRIGFIIMEKLAELVSGRLRETRIQLVNMIHG